MQGFLVENARVISAAVPIDTTGAIQTGDWVHLRHFRRAMVVFQQGAWAAGTSAVTFNQAKTNAGGSTKALAPVRYWQYTALTNDIPASNAGVTITAGTFNLPATANTTTIVEIHVDDLDKNNGFYYFNAVTASPGANADLLCITYILYDAQQFAGGAASIPTAISG